MNISDIVDKIKKFPPFPDVVYKLLELLNKPDYKTEDVVKVISLDSLLTARILKLCNSPVYGFRKKITSVNRAVILLGRNTLTNLAISVCSSRYFDSSQEGYMLKRGELWKNSITSAFASELLAQKIGYDDTSLLFTSTLLKDIGKIILDSFVKEKNLVLKKKLEDNCKPFNEIEKEVFGYHHGEVGAELLERWNFPDIIIDAVHYHHEPEKAQIDRNLASLVQLADYTSMVLGIGAGIDGLQYKINLEELSNYRLSRLDIQQILIQLVDKIESIENFLSI